MRIAESLVAVTVLTLAACDPGAGIGPEDVTGTYTLIRFNDALLPATVVTPSDPCEVVIMRSGSLTLEDGGGFALAQAFDFSTHCEGAPEPWEFTLEGTYTLTGDSIFLDVPPDWWWDFAGTATGRRVRVSPQIPSHDQDSERFVSYTFGR